MVDSSVVPNTLSSSKVLSKTVSPNYAPNTEVGTSISGQCLSMLGSQGKLLSGAVLQPHSDTDAFLQHERSSEIKTIDNRNLQWFNDQVESNENAVTQPFLIYIL